MSDVLALVAAEADGVHAVEVAIAISYCVKIQNVEKSCVPRIFADAVLIVAVIM
ncbi:hypothetical protein [Stenotrophomonas maltophilia]